MTNLVKSSFIPDEQIRRFITIDELLNEADKKVSLQLASAQRRLEALKIDLVGFCFDPIAARYLNRFGKIGKLIYLVTPALDISSCDIVTSCTNVLGARSFLTLQIASVEDIRKALLDNGRIPKHLLTLDVPWSNYTTTHITRSIGCISIDEGFEKSYHYNLRVIFEDLVDYEALLELSDCLYQMNYYEKES